MVRAVDARLRRGTWRSSSAAVLGVGRDRAAKRRFAIASTRSHDEIALVVGAAQNPPSRGLRRWMRLKLVLFAGAREAAGVAEAQLDFEEAELDTAALLVKLGGVPKLAELLPRCALACNGEYADGVQPLADGDEVAVIPPVSGG